MKLKHLEMVQAVIARMNQDSFLLKGWSITLAAAILAVAFSGDTPRLCIIALVPIIIFWGLDAFYMRDERLFRAMHRAIAEDIRNNTNKIALFDMDTQPFIEEVGSFSNNAWARTVWPIYFVLAALVIMIHFTHP